MANEWIEVSRKDVAQLLAAADSFYQQEITRLVPATIDTLSSMAANNTFADVAARHLWDEYSWCLQEGPFDDQLEWNDLSLSAISGSFENLVRTLIQTEVEKLSQPALIFLSVQASNDDVDRDEVETLGSIWVDGIVSLVLDEVKTHASRRKLGLIGPDRGEVIVYEIEGSGMVWSVLANRDEAMDLVASHCDVLLDPDGDLTDIADEMVDAFWAAVADDNDGAIVTDFLECFEDELRMLLRENDVVPSLEDMRVGLLNRLDG